MARFEANPHQCRIDLIFKQFVNCNEVVFFIVKDVLFDDDDEWFVTSVSTVGWCTILSNPKKQNKIPNSLVTGVLKFGFSSRTVWDTLRNGFKTQTCYIDQFQIAKL